MDLIGRILRFGECEVFTYLDYKAMNRWITDPNKAETFTRAYGGEEWRECIHLPEDRRRAGLLDRYKSALKDKKRGHAKYVSSFLMFDNHGQPLYWLVFCTNNLRGLEEMKRAMWSVDKTGNFRFSDRENPDQLTLLDESCSQEWLAGELTRLLGGRKMTVAEVREFVLTDTPCYLFKAALKALECGQPTLAKVIASPVDRKPGTYPDGMLDKIAIEFENPSLF